jgi:hypothetical protein
LRHLRIPVRAFARPSRPGLERFVIVSRCEEIELERSAARPRHGTARPGRQRPPTRVRFCNNATGALVPLGTGGPLGRQKFKGLEMTKSRGIGRGGARPGSGRKRKAITSRVAALKNVLAALLSSDASNFRDADRRFVRAMIALGAPNNVTAGAFGISEVELLAKFRDELQSRPRESARPD